MITKDRFGRHFSRIESLFITKKVRGQKSSRMPWPWKNNFLKLAFFSTVIGSEHLFDTFLLKFLKLSIFHCYNYLIQIIILFNVVSSLRSTTFPPNYSLTFWFFKIFCISFYSTFIISFLLALFLSLIISFINFLQFVTFKAFFGFFVSFPKGTTS